ncbi:hypothetical protein BDZ45DRAFT_69572 [Acephala macrosclerotiorum]|nr:hypothetical protein BDZ45DRAFT_69572 [Acephala macrosclerotiorum]
MASTAPSTQSPSNASEDVPPHFRFLELPAEIRNMIYELLLVSSEPVHITTPIRKAIRQKASALTIDHKANRHHILRVNKQIHQEA